MIKEDFITVRSNPFYDDIIIFLDSMLSSQDKLKPIDSANGIFKLYEKNNVTEFRRLLTQRLETKRKPSWPYKCDLFMAVSVSGTKKNIYDKDLDNLMKTLFDTLKGVVFVEDKQIIKLAAEKDITNKYQGVMVALKKLSGIDVMRIFPDVYMTGKDIWLAERKEKIEKGENTYFDDY